MQADNQVGFYGSGTGWSFLMNTQTGAVSFGGDAGQPGQVLTSNGTSGAPSWQEAGGGKPFVVRPTAYSSTVSGTTRVDVPGLIANFTLTAPSTVVFNYKVRVIAAFCVACGEKKSHLILAESIIGGTTDVSNTIVYVPNNENTDGISGPIIVDLQPGSYSYKVVLASTTVGASSIYSSLLEGNLIWQIYPN